MKNPNGLTERGAQRKIWEQYDVKVKLENIGVGDYNDSRKQWPVYVSSGGSPDIYWVD